MRQGLNNLDLLLEGTGRGSDAVNDDITQRKRTGACPFQRHVELAGRKLANKQGEPVIDVLLVSAEQFTHVVTQQTLQDAGYMGHERLSDEGLVLEEIGTDLVQGSGFVLHAAQRWTHLVANSAATAAIWS